MRNPFIPSRSPICRAADWMLIGIPVLAGFVAAIVCIAAQIGAATW